MSKHRHKGRGVSVGTVFMILLTTVVLVSFCILMPKLTGDVDVRTNAAELAVALDQSISQIASVASVTQKPPVLKAQATILPPQNLATAAPPTTPPKMSFSLCAAGSIMLNTAVQKAVTDQEGYHYSILFDQMNQAMNADLTIATLESNVIPTTELSENNAPVDVLSAIKNAGVDALCLGYFGILDNGLEGAAKTKENVASAGMLPYGVYTSAQEREKPSLVNVNGISVALLSYQNELSSAGKKNTTKEEQSFAIASQQLPTISSEIAAARQAGAQVVVVSLCWGKANATSPSSTQRELAQGIADAGADVILGTHSGTLQTVEILTAKRGDELYHPVLCAYSLGNLFTYDRSKRSSLASILLKTEVVYDTGTQTVAFDNLHYLPTYSWRDKQDGKMRYRVLLNNGQYPSFIEKDQKSVMERCLKLVENVMKDSPIAAAP
ncbi:MAG: CapA family protein [Clostridia bacterium]